MLKKQSISDWALEHEELLGQALEEGVTNLTDAGLYLSERMESVDFVYLCNLWEKVREEVMLK
jgi:predicted oxidoreductase|tara:strand:- start:783 stop:971 length:189 start_codon:yes stop_codon:yes gene_type:complete